jgi:hypothetical protein
VGGNWTSKANFSKLKSIEELGGDGRFPVQLHENEETHEKIPVKKSQRRIRKELFIRESERLTQIGRPCIVPLFGRVPRVGKDRNSQRTCVL